MCRRRRKTLTVVTGTIFVCFTVALLDLRRALDVADAAAESSHSSAGEMNSGTSFIGQSPQDVDKQLIMNNVVKEPVKKEIIWKKMSDIKIAKMDTANDASKSVIGALKSNTNGASLFDQKLSVDEKRIVYDLLSSIHETMTSSNLTYWMYSGTLLGSFRHHDLIPWDDDVDILTDFKTKDKLISDLEKLSPKYTVYVAGNRLKFFLTDGQKTSQYPWTFPYVDISFYAENATNPTMLYDYSDNQDMKDYMYVYKKKDIFPLHLRPLGDLMLNAPHDALANLRATYMNLHICRSPHYQHRTESLLGSPEEKPCLEVRNSVPFVHRKRAERGVEETLKIGTEVIQTVIVDEPNNVITDPYTLNLL